ncbi:unnamed protein product [Dracunculus medinensis]|uniref:Costars domain-containing protein n=1 Tax=Dracunculus medinensis TaxID=318479 RepID=A0A0N4UGU4_DRAME|nr:unnamed protein product [Dracunculus medinensis]
MPDACTEIGKRSSRKNTMVKQSPPWIAPSTNIEVIEAVKSYQWLEKVGQKGNNEAIIDTLDPSKQGSTKLERMQTILETVQHIVAEHKLQLQLQEQHTLKGINKKERGNREDMEAKDQSNSSDNWKHLELRPLKEKSGFSRSQEQYQKSLSALLEATKKVYGTFNLEASDRGLEIEGDRDHPHGTFNLVIYDEFNLI